MSVDGLTGCLLLPSSGCSQVSSLEEELRMIGENMKTLEVSEEKALWREEKFQTEIKLLMVKLKGADRKQEYGEKNINKLNHRIDEIEDDIVRQKLKVQKVANEMDDTFDDMMVNY
ncbi:tropomyosin [Eurytemora carolleeae]|uniref:tropomyosin n=1 Tax=Eurytemora carolleeae TaxID=1294199 RepID=UPI000C768E46|nr:tropomyosin [Eurytemora carolleeae]|eukprot:XP_023345948.1 tropomyosin-like [Eurytemora affinis]